MNRELEIGQKVRLSKNTRWNIGDHNPLNLVGEIISNYDWVVVVWDNCIRNEYKPFDDDLIPIDKYKDAPR